MGCYGLINYSCYIKNERVTFAVETLKTTELARQ